VPLHNWLPDAHSKVLRNVGGIIGLIIDDALYAVCATNVGGWCDPFQHGRLFNDGFGLLSFLVGALFLHRQKDIKRLFSYSSIEHMGLMTFAFGVGGPLATFAALLHMTCIHSLNQRFLSRWSCRASRRYTTHGQNTRAD